MFLCRSETKPCASPAAKEPARFANRFLVVDDGGCLFLSSCGCFANRVARFWTWGPPTVIDRAFVGLKKKTVVVEAVSRRKRNDRSGSVLILF